MKVKQLYTILMAYEIILSLLAGLAWLRFYGIYITFSINKIKIRHFLVEIVGLKK